MIRLTTFIVFPEYRAWGIRFIWSSYWRGVRIFLGFRWVEIGGVL